MATSDLYPANPRRNATNFGAQLQQAAEELKVQSLSHAGLEMGPQVLNQLVEPLGPLVVGEINPSGTKLKFNYPCSHFALNGISEISF